MSDELTVEKIETTAQDYAHIALGIFKNRDLGLWQVVELGFNTDGSSGGMKVIYESGFRDEANESFKIAVSKSGILG